MRKRRLCRECNKIECRKYQEKNRDKIADRKRKQREATKEQQTAYSREYYNRNRERRLQKARDWHAANKSSVAARHEQWRKENASKRVASVGKRNAIKLKAMPVWADEDKINAFYEEAARLSEETGIKHHVDHIFPLQGKTCCGLHVHTNLQILTALENVSKHNKMPQNEHSW
jgi:hypothetical protein